MKSDTSVQTLDPAPKQAGLMTLLFQQHPDAMLLVDMSGRILEANGEACRLMGCPLDELLALRAWQIIPGASQLEVREWMRSLERGAVETLNLSYRSCQSVLGRVEATVRRVEAGENGDCLIVACRECRERSGSAASEQRQKLLQLQRHNKVLIEAEERLRLAMELGRVGLWVWHATPDSNPGHWSDRLKEIFGVPLDAEVTHDMFIKCVHPEDRVRVDAAVRQALSGHDHGRYSLEYRTAQSEKQESRWVLARGQAFFDAQGSPIRFIGSVLDITERKRAEESLALLNNGLEQRIEERTSELACANRALKLQIEVRQQAEDTLRRNKEDLRLVIDTIPGLVWSSLPDGNIEYLNKRWLDFTGLTLAQASGWGWQSAVHPDDLPDLVTYWKSILAEGKAGETEARLRHHGGSYRWFLFRGVPVYDAEGNVVKWYGTNTDVEERRASEHLARGQSEVLVQTLSAVSKESNPDRLLAHVLKTITSQLSAHSIGVWQTNERTGTVEMVASCEGDVLHLADVEQPEQPPPVAREDAPHPVWTEFFGTGKYCIAGDLTGGQIRVRKLDGTDSPWHDWYASVVGSPNAPIIMQRLIEQGVTATLSVPMLLAGKVCGFLSVRFQRRPSYQCEEIELARALTNQVMLALQLLRLTRESHRLAVLAERNRMARELHDTLAQGITAVIVQLEAAEDATARGLLELVDPHLKRARELARQTLREARRSVRAMRPQALKDQDLPEALSTLLRQMGDGTGLQAEMSLRGVPRKLPSRCEENILRICQEVLTNALRHAQATHFVARLIFSPAAVWLHLHDDGRGFDPAESHDGFGLTGILERVEGMGGRLAIRSEAGRGTVISIRLGNSIA